PADGFLGMRFGILTVQIASIRRLVSLVHLLSQRCERRNLVAEASISTIPACAAAAITAWRAIARPESGQIVLVVSLVIIGGIVGHDGRPALRQYRDRNRQYDQED